MSASHLLSLAPVPCLDFAVTLLTSTYENVQNVKVYKQQCQDMSSRCVNLVLAVQEGMHGQESNDWASELEGVLRAINEKIKEWGAMGRLKSFLQQSEIKVAIEGFQRDIDAAMMKYHISASLEIQRGMQEARAIQERDKAEIREVLQTIVQSTADMRALVNHPSSQPVEEIMEHLQMELMDPNIPKPQEQSFREGLWYLHSRTSKLPPLTELTGQVTKESEHTAFIGTYNDVFRGRWLDKEKVALRLPRNLPNKATLQRRFEREVTVWRQLEHPNVLPLYGIAKIGEHVFSVSPWMDNGTAISFVQDNPDCNRLRLLSEIVAGMEYLHFQDIVHGDLRGANVLISEDGVARLADFGLSKFLGDCGQGMTSAPNINPRWFAPELIRQTGTFSKESDIWSLSMTFLELLTGQQPFSDSPMDVAVLRLIDRGKTPSRPTGHQYVVNGLNDSMWSLIKECWKSKPESRPSIQEIRDKLKKIREQGDPGLLQAPPSNGSLSSDSQSPSGRPSIVIPVVNRDERQGRSISDRPSTGGSSASGGSAASGRLRKQVTFPNGNTIEEIAIPPPTSYPRTPSISSSPKPSPHGFYPRRDSRSTDSRQNSGPFLEPVARPNPPSSSPYSESPKLIPNPTLQPQLDIPQVSSSPPSRGTGGSSFEDDVLYPQYKYKPSPSFNYQAQASRKDRRPSDSRQEDSGFLNPRPSTSYSSAIGNTLTRQYERAPQLDFPDFSSSPPPSQGGLYPPFSSTRTRSIDTVAIKPVPSILSASESGSQSPRPLKDAISSSELIIYTNNGEIVAGTLEGLIERLINNFNFRADMEYRDVLLTACIDFITPEELFTILARRFEEAEQGRSPSLDHLGAEERVGIQYTIFKVIIYWLSKRHLPINTDLLWQMRNFCWGAIRLKTSQTMVEKGNDLLALIEERAKEQAFEEALSSPFDVSPGRTTKTAAQITPWDLAIALTLLEGDKFRKIMPCDYLAHQRQQPINGYQNRVDVACVVNNRIIQWIKQSILHYDDVKYRVDVIKFYINTALECRKLRNYGSLIAVATALDSAPVERLRLTKSQLSPKMGAALNEIVSILNPTGNHTAYRAALREIKDPEYKGCCIPWLGLHLKQLHSVLVENPRVVEIDHRHLINFKRYVEYVKLFNEILGFEPPNLEKYRDHGQLAYLERQLADVKISDSADDELMARSVALEAGENKLYANRILERQSLGFAIPRKSRTIGK